MLDQSLIGEHVAAHMDALEAEYGEGWTVTNVITVVQLVAEDGNAQIRVRSAPEEGPRTSELLGMLEVSKAIYVQRMTGQ
jgi:hypothetical protein